MHGLFPESYNGSMKMSLVINTVDVMPYAGTVCLTDWNHWRFLCRTFWYRCLSLVLYFMISVFTHSPFHGHWKAFDFATIICQVSISFLSFWCTHYSNLWHPDYHNSTALYFKKPIVNNVYVFLFCELRTLK